MKRIVIHTDHECVIKSVLRCSCLNIFKMNLEVTLLGVRVPLLKSASFESLCALVSQYSGVLTRFLRRNIEFLQVSTVYKASHAQSRFPFPSYRPRYWLNINHGIIWSENTTQSLKGRTKFPLFCLKQFLRYSKTNRCLCTESAGVYCVLFFIYTYVTYICKTWAHIRIQSCFII